MALRLIFCGTADIACPSLAALAENKAYELVAVVTQPDKPKGRHLQLQPSAVKVLALQLGLPVLQPARARDEAFIQQVRDLAPDLMIVIAYGQILPQSLLDIPRYGCLNIHTSILPRHRGAAPIQWAILSGDSETGVTIMKMDAGLDTGPILSIQKTPILPADNSQTLHDRLATLGSDLLLKTIPRYISGELLPQPQPDGATYARKISKEDGRIDWSQPAREIWLKIRGLAPWPGAFTHLLQGESKKMLKIWEASPQDASGSPGQILEAGKSGLLVACGEGALGITALQPEGRKQMAVGDFLAGHALGPEDRLVS